MKERKCPPQVLAIRVLAVLVVALALASGQYSVLVGARHGGQLQTGTMTSVAAAPARFSLSDIPAIKNKTAINMVVETGATWDKILPYIKKFTEKTGVPVNIDRIASSGVYAKENLELVGGTARYDAVYVETAWTNEWAPYMIPFADLAKTYDPAGVKGLEEELKHFSPVLLRAGQTSDGAQMVLPFYTYQVGMFIRQDVFDDAREKANFQKRFGYALAPATTPKQLLDQAKFFSRKKGELLKGQPLTHDLKGLAMMAGAYQINDEITSRLWGAGADYATVVRDQSGKVTKFVITKKDTAALKQVLAQYVEEAKYASAGDLTANFDFTSAEQGDGRAIIQPTQFTDLFVYTADLLKKNLPNARLAVYPSVGGQPYTGAWSLGVARASKNQEAAYWLIRYLASYEAQVVTQKEGGQVAVRTDVLRDPIWYTAANKNLHGLLNTYLIDIWNKQAKYVNNYWYFNSDAAGKIYDMQISIMNKAVSGTSVDRVVQELQTKTMELQNKFGKIKMTRE